MEDSSQEDLNLSVESSDSESMIFAELKPKARPQTNRIGKTDIIMNQGQKRHSESINFLDEF